jgi:predicted nuclease with RNAse H fold
MFTAGVDLAAEAKGTAVAILHWMSDGVELKHLDLGVADEAIVEIAVTVQKIGIDCALGWPIQFIDFLNQQATLTGRHSIIDGGKNFRRELSFRETDRQVREITGRWPLSVATDRLGLTAIRAAGLLSKMQASGIEVDRSGAGRIVEIYPGASLRIWGFETRQYRTSPERRQVLITQLRKELPELDLGGFEGLMVKSCDAFDAVIAALATRAAYLGLSTKPNESQLQSARQEGWIALPTSPIGHLLEI